MVQSQYDFNLEAQNTEPFRTAFITATTQDKPDFDAMIASFNSLAAAYDDLQSQAEADDLIRQSAVERINGLNEQLNKYMQEIIVGRKEDNPNDPAEKEKAEEAMKNDALSKLF